MSRKDNSHFIKREYILKNAIKEFTRPCWLFTLWRRPGLDIPKAKMLENLLDDIFVFYDTYGLPRSLSI